MPKMIELIRIGGCAGEEVLNQFNHELISNKKETQFLSHLKE